MYAQPKLDSLRLCQEIFSTYNRQPHTLLVLLHQTLDMTFEDPLEGMLNLSLTSKDFA